MPYIADTIYEPYSIDDDQDLWVGTITYEEPSNTKTPDKHHECIEIRADTEELLVQRADAIIAALNNMETGVTLKL